MERAEDAVLPCAPEDETKEEIYAQLLEDPSITIDAKNKISRMISKWELNVEELNAENKCLKKAMLSYNSYFLSKELDIMILERVNAMSLKQVALVKRSWRSYITVNELKMRAYIVDYIKIGIPSDQPVKLVKLNGLKLELYQPKREKWVSLSQLLHYQPQGYLKFATHMSNLNLYLAGLYTKQLRQIESLPKWWFTQIKKVECSVKGSFIDGFKHLSELCVCIDENSANINYLVNFIDRAPKADSLIIRVDNGINHFLVDEVLEAVITKSFTFSAEFPIFVGKSSFTVGKIIRFIEANQFTSNQIHHIHIFSPIIGTVEEWNEWLRSNSSQLQYFHPNAYAENIVVGASSYPIMRVANNRWKFIFREEYFDVVLDSFAASPVLQ